MSNSTPSSAADALAVVVRDFGRLVGQDPSRLRGLLEDVLGAQARAERLNIDAIVTAAEHGVAASLVDGDAAPERELEGRLVAEGMAGAMATYAVSAWVRVLGGEPAVITEPAGTPSDPPGDGTIPAEPTPPTGAGAGATSLPPPAATILVDDADAPAQKGGPVTRSRRRRWLLVTGIAAVVLAVVGTVIAVQNSGDSPAAATATAAPSTTPSTTTTAATTTTTAATTTTTVATTTTAAPATTAAPPDTTPPPLVVAEPTYDAVFDMAALNVSGTSEPVATVTVNGEAAAVDTSGNWQYAFTLAEGDNVITVEATDALGNKATASILVHYAPPAPPPGSTTRTTKKPVSGATPAPPSGQTPSEPVPDEPVPEEPAPTPAPPVAAGDSKSFTASISANNDPQATSLSVLGNDSGSGIRITAASQGSHGSVSFSGSSVSYRPHTNGPISDSFRYTITDSLGRTSSATVTVSVACNPSFPCGS